MPKMMGIKTNTPKTTSAFTIVELLIVIVVIAILAVVTIVGYNGVSRNAVVSSVQSSLQSIGQRIATEHIKSPTGEYPTTFPDGISATEGVGFAFTYVSSSTAEFCVNGTAANYDDITYHIDQTQIISEGLCEGEVIVESIIGDYNEDAGVEVGFVVPPKERTVSSGGAFNLTVHIPEEWDQIEISWTTPAEMPTDGYFEIMTRKTSDGTWYYRWKTDGAYQQGSGYANNSSYSGTLSYGTNAVTWTNTNVIPFSAGEDYEYRIRYKDSSNANPSEWDAVALGNIIQSDADLPSQVENFAVANATDWSNIGLTWDQVPDFAIDMSEVKYEVMTRNLLNGTWYYRNIDTGDWNKTLTSGYDDVTSYSGMFAYNDTDATWTHANSVPYSSGQNYEYQIRAKIMGSETFYTDWSSVTLDNPIQSTADLPSTPTLSVANAGDWSNIVLSWAGIPEFAVNMGEVQYEIMTRRTTDGTWYYRWKTDGAYQQGASYADSSSYSGAIDYGETSVTWTDNYVVPRSAGQDYEYRIRFEIEGEESFYSEWQTVALGNPIQSASDLPATPSLSVTPAGDWSNVVLDWSGLSDFAVDMTEVQYEIMTRTSSSATWYYRWKTDGAYAQGSGYADNSSYSGTFANTQTSATWTNANVIPSSGETYEYRVRYQINGELNLFTDWVTTSLTRP